MWGHFRAAKIHMTVRQCIFGPEMRKGVKDYTKGYNTCARVDQQAGKVVGFVKPLPVARGRSDCIGVHCISFVPTSLWGNDSIVTFGDYFSKCAHWKPCTQTIDTTEFIQWFLEAIIQLVGVPQEIVSDRDVHMMLDFWAEVSTRIQTKLLISMPFHPQFELLSEIFNKQVTQYLPAVSTHHQDQSDTMRPLAEYRYHTSTHSSTDCSPFGLNLGYPHSIQFDYMEGQWKNHEMRNLKGAAFIEWLQASLLDAQDRLNKAQDSPKAEASRSRRPCTLEVGYFGMLRTKDLPITYWIQDPSW